MQIRLKKGKGKKPFYFVIVSGNGNPVATSKMYGRKDSCKRTAESIQDSIAEYKIIDDTR